MWGTSAHVALLPICTHLLQGLATIHGQHLIISSCALQASIFRQAHMVYSNAAKNDIADDFLKRAALAKLATSAVHPSSSNSQSMTTKDELIGNGYDETSGSLEQHTQSTGAACIRGRDLTITCQMSLFAIQACESNSSFIPPPRIR